MTRLVALIPSGRRLGAGLSPLLQPDPDRRLDIYQAAAVRGTGKYHSPHGRAMTFHVRESDGLESLRAHEQSRSSILVPAPSNCSRGPSNISSRTILQKIYRLVDPTSFISFLWFTNNFPTPPTPFNLQHCTGRSIEITHSHVVPRPINLRPSRKYSFATTALVNWSWASHSVSYRLLAGYAVPLPVSNRGD